MRRVAKVLSIVGIVALAACSSGGSNNAASTSSSSSSSSSKSSSSGGGGTASFDATACADAGKALSEAGNFASNGSGNLKDQALKARDAMNALADTVSDSDTKDALHTLAKAYEDFGNAIGDTNYDPSKGGVPPQEVIAAIQVFAKPEFAQAASKLSTYFAGGCKG